ncbi:major coat protein [Alteromonas phage vB_AmaP_AD45-P2]|nr:N4-gp56 family major capsid protein [Pseudorhizobium pelagicum]AGM46947.1 major coat protein [Alteromonas phage vB_AmaP_AD45-P3]AGM47064.1 major coat protein [Alteromonas phage vB_AmaP_AD45-P4]AGM47180.1 major coat protein [Alteromonas phage vB_AmaP_AD45-P2]
MPTTNVYGNGTNSTAGANTIVHFYDRAGVKAANRTNVYGQFADRKSMPKKMGKTFKISKFLHMYDRALNDAEFSAKGFLSARDIDQVNTALNDASLAEGAGAVNKRSLKKITMETSLARYGEMIDYTDEVELFSEDAIQVRYREELGELANSRMEDLMQLDMLATPTVMYGGSATAIGEVDADSTVSYDLIRKGVRKLVRNRAQKNTQMVTGDVKVDTRTVAKSYYAVIGANVKGDLETLTRGTVADNGTTEFVYIPAHKYGSAATLAEGEVGAMHEVRFIESESAVVYAGQGADATGYTGNLSVTNGKFDAFPILFPTQGAFATVGLKGQGKIKFNSKSPEVVENANPYGTNGFFSYNFFYAGIILEEEKLLKILVSASA